MVSPKLAALSDVVVGAVVLSDGPSFVSVDQ